MDRLPPPLLGFNNNVQHNGRTFHIQTEDSGLKYCRVVTHLFADGGRILQTRRTDYASHRGEPDLIDQVRQLMKSQHRAMFSALRAGEFDEAIRATFQGPTPAELESADSPTSQRPHLRVQEMPALTLRAAELSKPPESARVSTPAAAPETSTESVLARAESPSRKPESKTEPPPKRPSSRPKRPSSKPAPSTRRSGTIESSEPAIAALKPSSSSGLFNAPKPRPTIASNDAARRQANGGSIFGDNSPSEQSLDDVILSYLEDDPSESPGRT